MSVLSPHKHEHEHGPGQAQGQTQDKGRPTALQCEDISDIGAERAQPSDEFAIAEFQNAAVAILRLCTTTHDLPTTWLSSFPSLPKICENLCKAKAHARLGGGPPPLIRRGLLTCPGLLSPPPPIPRTAVSVRRSLFLPFDSRHTVALATCSMFNVDDSAEPSAANPGQRTVADGL